MQVAIIGIVTTLITTAGVVIAAVVNNKKERTGAADEGIAATLRERITLRDEQLADLREDKRDLQARLDTALEANEEQILLIQHLRDELAECKGETDHDHQA